MAVLQTILSGLAQGFIDLFMLPWTIWQWFHMEVLKERMIALTLGGQSLAFLYMVLSAVLLVLVLGLISRRFLRGTVLSLEAFNRRIGQIASWFVLLLMLQQVLIIIMGQVFRGNELLFSPFGIALSNAELQWLSGQLKLYNAILITFASAYTFIEGGHVRVDLVYGSLGYRARRLIDLFGAVVFMLPATILMWWFAWPLAMNAMFAQRPMNIFSDRASWRGVRLETSGTAEFTWVWTFKVLIVIFAALLFLQAVAFMLRNVWALLDKGREVDSHPLDPSEHPATEPDIDLGQPTDHPAAGDTFHVHGRSGAAPLPAGSAQADPASTVVVDEHSPATAEAIAHRTATAPAGPDAKRLDSVRVPVPDSDRPRVKPTSDIASPSLAPAGAHRRPKGGQ